MATETIYWLEVVKTFGPIVVGLGGIYLGFKSNMYLLKSKGKEAKREEISKKLNEFYGPFQQLRRKNEMLYELFREGKGTDFRTLTALLQGQVFTDNDKELLTQIIEVNGQLETLIINNSGLIDDVEMRNLLSKATAHYKIISLAYKGLLKDQSDRFKDYVYPRELDEKIEQQINSLEKKLSMLYS